MHRFSKSEKAEGLSRSILHYVDGAFVSEKDARVSALDLGLLRGYGVFDYFQVYKGRPLHLMDHLIRLKWSCEQVELPLPMTLDEIGDLTYAIIKKNGPMDAGVRLVITGGGSGEDLLVPQQGSNLMILFHPYTPHPDRYYTQGMRVVTTKMLRLMPSVKTTNYMPAIFAMKKARERDFDDALYLNDRQEILEGTTSNAFFFKEDTWITSDSDELVKGVTRAIFLGLVQEKYRIEYRSLHLSEIGSCEEAFLCSSVKDAISLVQIDDQKVGRGIPGPHTAHLRKIYREYIENYVSREHSIEKIRGAV